jgi:hypothetical protein
MLLSYASAVQWTTAIGQQEEHLCLVRAGNDFWFVFKALHCARYMIIFAFIILGLRMFLLAMERMETVNRVPAQSNVHRFPSGHTQEHLKDEAAEGGGESSLRRLAEGERSARPYEHCPNVTRNF